MRALLILLVCFVLGYFVAVGCGMFKDAWEDNREPIAGAAGKGGAVATGIGAERLAAGDYLGAGLAFLVGIGATYAAGRIRKKSGGTASPTPGASEVDSP